jgi:hypothetical protein
MLLLSGSTDEIEDRIRTDLDGEVAENTCSCLTAHGKADDFQHLRQTQGATRIGSSDPGEALGENAARTVGHAAEEAPGGEMETDGDPLPREIGQRSLIGAVNGLRGVMAEGTERLIACGGDDHDESVLVRPEEVQTHAGWVEKNGGSADDRDP